eukprot:358404-Chlamydomonas_euryale.AAC.9
MPSSTPPHLQTPSARRRRDRGGEARTGSIVAHHTAATAAGRTAAADVSAWEVTAGTALVQGGERAGRKRASDGQGQSARAAQA